MCPFGAIEYGRPEPVSTELTRFVLDTLAGDVRGADPRFTPDLLTLRIEPLPVRKNPASASREMGADDLLVFFHETTLKQIGALRGGEVAFQARGEPERVRVGRVTSGFFRVLGVRRVQEHLVDHIERLADEGLQVGLAISLHAPTQAARRAISSGDW